MDIKTRIENFKPQSEQERADKELALRMTAEYPDTGFVGYNTLGLFTASFCVMYETLDKVLMVHHLIYRTWAWTGGHADGDDDLLRVAIREAQEETGVQDLKPLTGEMDSLDVLPVYGHLRRGEYVGTHLHLNASYILIASEEEAVRQKDDENDGVQWIPMDRLVDYSNEPYLIRIYEKLGERAKAYGK